MIDPESFNGLPDKLINELKASSHFLRYTEDARTKSTIYNFPLKELSTSDLREHLKLILSNLPCAAKVNFAFGFVLRDITEDVYRYHHAADNSTVFEKPFVLSNQADIDFVLDMLPDEDIFQMMVKDRPSTNWKFEMVTNVTYFVYYLTNVPVGCSRIDLPNTLLRSKNVCALTYNYHSRTPYRDNPCLLRAIVLQK